MDIISINPYSENESVFENADSKPQSMLLANNVANRKKGLSLITNTPINRKKFGNLSNTPLRSLKKPTIDLKQDDSAKCSSLKKNPYRPAKIVEPLSNVSNKNKKILNQMPIVYEEIENCNRMNFQEFQENHFPSEISDHFINEYHQKIISAPFDDIVSDSGPIEEDFFDLFV
ncbi:hypothetical protein NH340_JMT02525 [Sarcoptes scabiei]|nr:hypothetical protein NH340_JMT02525 [Sarcoptes scabiei]